MISNHISIDCKYVSIDGEDKIKLTLMVNYKIFNHSLLPPDSELEDIILEIKRLIIDLDNKLEYENDKC